MTEAQRKSNSQDRLAGRTSDHSHRQTWSPDLDIGRGALSPKADDPAPGIAYADLPRRSVAFFLDVMLVQTTTTLVLQVTGFVAGLTLLNATGVTDNSLNAWLGFALPTLVLGILQALVIVFFLRSYAATPGQVILGINTVRASDGQRLGKGRALVRWLATLMPVWAIAASSNLGVWWAASIMRSASISADAVFPSGFAIAVSVIWFLVLLVSMLLNSQGRGLQDRLAGSVVVSDEG
jgi:RDD family